MAFQDAVCYFGHYCRLHSADEGPSAGLQTAPPVNTEKTAVKLKPSVLCAIQPLHMVNDELMISTPWLILNAFWFYQVQCTNKDRKVKSLLLEKYVIISSCVWSVLPGHSFALLMQWQYLVSFHLLLFLPQSLQAF